MTKLVSGALALGLLTAADAAPASASGSDWSDLLPGLTMAYNPASTNACTAGRTRCIRAVIREMRRRYRPLARACDHKAIFALSYLRTTEEYQRTTADPTFFEDTRFVNHEDAVFARLYFDAADNWQAGRLGQVPPAWAIAMRAAEERTQTAGGDLSLGINAHVQRDLPFVLAGIGLVRRDGSSFKRDHDKVNEFLDDVTSGLIAEIARRYDPTIDDVGPTTMDDTVVFKIIVAWREKAWQNAERLARARSSRARAKVAADIEAYAAEQAEFLRASTLHAPGAPGAAARDAYCAAAH